MKNLSGKFVLRVPHKLHASLRARSDKLGISLNSLCVDLIQKSFHEQTILSQFELEEISKKLGENLHGIILFGSFARGTQNDNSDIDILIVIKNSLPLTRDLYRNFSFKNERISIHFAHLPMNGAEAGSLWLECAIDGKILLDSEASIQNKLREIRNYILSGKAIRKETHGQGYWVRV